MACVNVFSRNDYVIRGHSSRWDRRNSPAGREYGTLLHFNMINYTQVQEAIDHEEGEYKQVYFTF